MSENSSTSDTNLRAITEIVTRADLDLLAIELEQARAERDRLIGWNELLRQAVAAQQLPFAEGDRVQVAHCYGTVQTPDPVRVPVLLDGGPGVARFNLEFVHPLTEVDQPDKQSDSERKLCSYRLQPVDGPGWACDLHAGHESESMHSYKDLICWSTRVAVRDGGQ
jgi:hypothetical protein